MGVRTANSGSFAKGDNRPRKKKGDIHTLTIEKIKFREYTKDFEHYMNNEGFSRFIAEMEALKGYAYVSAYLSLMEYTHPKLSRLEVTQEQEQIVINVFGKVPEIPTELLPNNYIDSEDITTEQDSGTSELDL